MPHRPLPGSTRKSSRKVPFRPHHPTRGRWPTFDEMKEQKYGQKWHYDRAKYVPDPNQAGSKSSKRKPKKRRSVGRRTLLKRRKKQTHRRR